MEFRDIFSSTQFHHQNKNLKPTYDRYLERDPEVACWPSGFGGLGYQGQKTTHLLWKSGFLPCHSFLENVRFWALVPQASKKALGPKNTSGSRGLM